MRLVLDSNEYIFVFGKEKKLSCVTLIGKILANPSAHVVRISRIIVEEVKNNLSAEDFKEFINCIAAFTGIDEDVFVPFEIGLKYETLLKPGDAFIAAYAESIGTDILVTENRHFLTHQANLPFKILNAENCLKIL